MWLVTTEAPAYQFVVRLSVDQTFLRQTLSEWGIWAPVIFILLQALQVIVAPIPGEVTGVLGGFLFGEWYGLLYSLVGMTVGSVAAFTIGRWLGARSVRALVGQQIWDRIHVVVEARGAGLCAITYFIPGLPKVGLLSLRHELDAPLALCSGVDTRSRARNMGSVDAGGTCGCGALPLCLARRGDRDHGRVAALLLPKPNDSVHSPPVSAPGLGR